MLRLFDFQFCFSVCVLGLSGAALIERLLAHRKQHVIKTCFLFPSTCPLGILRLDPLFNSTRALAYFFLTGWLKGNPRGGNAGLTFGILFTSSTATLSKAKASRERLHTSRFFGLEKLNRKEATEENRTVDEY